MCRLVYDIQFNKVILGNGKHMNILTTVASCILTIWLWHRNTPLYQNLFIKSLQ